MGKDRFSEQKRVIEVRDARVAYHDTGEGEPLLLLHGCPFSSFIWRRVIAGLSTQYRCLAPDLLGLGDTETPRGADWSLPAQARMVIGVLDALGIDRAHVAGHDHGGAVAQLLAAEHAGRVNRLVLSNAEAYDNWPSAEERPFVRATQLPLFGTLLLWLWSWKPLLRLTLISGKAVHDASVLTPELLYGYARANLGDRHRRAKTKRFLRGQLDSGNNRVTTDLLPGLRRFDHPTLLIWARDDPHFGPRWAEMLARDIPGFVRLELLPDTGHLLMEEQPDHFAALVSQFLAEPPRQPVDR